MMRDQKFWILVELKIDYRFVLLSYGPGDQKFWISPRKKAEWVHDLFHMKLHNDGIRKLDVLFLVDSTEHFFLLISKSLSET